MANMGYCRFQNTYSDLIDCEDHMEDDLESEDEEKYRKRLIAACKRIAVNSEAAS